MYVHIFNLCRFTVTILYSDDDKSPQRKIVKIQNIFTRQNMIMRMCIHIIYNVHTMYIIYQVYAFP